MTESHSSPKMRITLVLGALVLLGALAPGRGAQAMPAQPDTADIFLRDTRELCKHAHRLAGTPEGQAAAEYVAAQLRAAGIETVLTLPFFVPQLQTDVKLEVNGRRVEAYGMRANFWLGPTTGGETLEGTTLYAGDGSIEAYGAESAEGRIVVLDYETAGAWHNAFAMGARAVIFIGTGGTPLKFPRYERICADLPRFYVPPAAADTAGLRQNGKTVRIRASAQWAAREACSIIAWLPGTAPVFADADEKRAPEEVVVLAARLDSFGQVPALCGGARNAANCAALLEIARRLQHDRPRRSVLIAFLNGEARSLAGASALYTAIFRATPWAKNKRTHADFIAEYKQEKAFLSQVADAVGAPDIFDVKGVLGRRALEMMRQEAQYHTHEVQSRLRDLRLRQETERAKLEKQGTGRRPPQPSSPALTRLQEQEAELEAEEEQWNDLQRALIKDKLTEENAPYLVRIRQAIRSTITTRRQELDTLIRHRNAAQAVGALLLEDASEARATRKKIVLHLAVDLGDGGPRWGIAHSDSALLGSDYNNVGYYVRVFKALSQIVERLRAEDTRALQFLEPETTQPVEETVREPKKKSLGRLLKEWLKLVEPETTKVQLGPPVFFPADTIHSGQIASRFRIYGLRLATCHDGLTRMGHPNDRPDMVDLEKIRRFAEDTVPFIRALASDPALSLTQKIRPTAAYEEPEWSGSQTTGFKVMTKTAGSAVANRVAAGALVGVVGGTTPGFDTAMRFVTDQNGNFATGPLPNPRNATQYFYAFLCGPHGRITSANARKIPSLRQITLFPCRMHTVTALAPPTFADAKTSVLNAASDGMFQATEFLSMEKDEVVSLFVPLAARGVKLVNRFGLCLLRTDPQHPTGIGFPVGAEWQPLPSERHSARDLFALNEDRLNLLRQRRITNDSLEWLHGLAKTALTRAAAATSTAAASAELGIARLLSRRVYAPLLGAINDLVKAVVILLLLSIPFAYALERLLIGTPHIYRQIAWYCFFFLLTFGALYKVHPAFAIATEPIVIFLAFAIIMLSAIVIFILLGRFQSEIRRVQGLEATVHTADVSRFSTVMAAVAMGISTMRRRPMRTVFTTVTVILLTFSILSFASFDAQQGILRRYVGAARDVRCVFIHNALWQTLPEQLVDIVKYMTGKNGTVTRRYWVSALSSQDAETFSLLVARADGAQTAQIKALVGVEQADLDGQPELKACLGANAELREDAVFLPPAIADALALSTGDEVLLRGQTFTFAGPLEIEALTRFVQIDETPIFPVDFADESLAQEQKPKGTSDEEMLEAANLQTESAFLPYHSASQIAIIHSRRALGMRAALVALSVYPAAGASTAELAERLARVSVSPVYATMKDGIYRLFFTTILATSGTTNLIIPIVLGGLIVFGTMLGSVADREKEIYSFSALGLAPAHIGMLFFAEAAVYAVVGGLGGYILAQVVARATGWLSTVAGISVPEMNYSSTNAIFAILTVMATVLLSTVYPAIRGSRSANPGVARTWALPKPEGDLWEFTFPFTVSEYDITGVISFLHEHFDNFSDCSLGLFLAEGTGIYAEDRNLNLTSRLALAPFDLGVTEEFLLTSLPSEIEGVDEVRVVIKRLSGTRGDWQRTNRPFISDLRKQFLIWRSIPAETMEIYRQRTLAALGKQKETDGSQTENGG